MSGKVDKNTIKAKRKLLSKEVCTPGPSTIAKWTNKNDGEKSCEGQQSPLE